VIVEIARDRVGETGGGEVREAVAARKDFARTGDDRNAHPDRFARGQAAVVREGVEGDVNAVVAGKHFGRWRPAEKFEPVGADAVPGEERGETRVRSGIVEAEILQNQTRVRDAVENLRPDANHSWRDLRENVEAPESDVLLGLGRQRRDRRRIGGWIEADVIV